MTLIDFEKGRSTKDFWIKMETLIKEILKRFAAIHRLFRNKKKRRRWVKVKGWSNILGNSGIRVKS